MSSKEERNLETADIPNVVICLDPGFDDKVLRDYGYVSYSYFEGEMPGERIEQNEKTS